MQTSWKIFAAGALAPFSVSVYATTYLSVSQAQAQIFPGAIMSEIALTLSDEQAREIERASGVDVRNRQLAAWRTAAGDWFLVDAVVGKHEFITFALGITREGAVKQVEIMEYRESYGHEVRNEAWRKQFVGKTAAQPVKLTRDIENIGGATLSSKNVTNGVRRLLFTWNTVLKKLGGGS